MVKHIDGWENLVVRYKLYRITYTYRWITICFKSTGLKLPAKLADINSMGPTGSVKRSLMKSVYLELNTFIGVPK